jgi:hypothetical protein
VKEAVGDMNNCTIAIFPTIVVCKEPLFLLETCQPQVRHNISVYTLIETIQNNKGGEVTFTSSG